MVSGVSSSLILSTARSPGNVFSITSGCFQNSCFPFKPLTSLSPYQLWIMLKTDGPSHLHCKNRKLKFLCDSSRVMMDSVSLLLFMGIISASLSFIIVYVITAVRVNCWGHQWPSSWRVRESTYALCLLPHSRDGRPNPHVCLELLSGMCCPCCTSSFKKKKNKTLN